MMPTWVKCVDGPLATMLVYRHGADWKEGDRLMISTDRSTWKRDGEGVWVSVYWAYMYRLIRVARPGADEWQLEFVKDLN